MLTSLARSSLAAVTSAFLFALPLSAFAEGQYILLADYDGNPGDTFDVRGYGFAPDQSVTVTFEGTTKTATADGGGNFGTSAFTVPFRLPGSYTINAQQGGLSASSVYHVNGFFPWGELMKYYLRPGESFGVIGRHYAPNEQVQLSGPNGVITTLTADGGGNFDASDVIHEIPWSWKLQNIVFRLVGQLTQTTSEMTLAVGDYYTNITPSRYYVPFNHAMTVDARDYAPNEMVDLYVNGAVVATKQADGGGNLVFDMTSPGSGMSFEVKAKGQSSGVESIRTVTLAQPGWAL